MGACVSAAASAAGPGPAGKYHLQKVKLGEGSFGTVWRATDRETEQIVAVKEINKAGMKRRGCTMQQMQQEIQIMRVCRNAGPTVLKLHDNWEDKRSVFLALTYCDGGDFGDKLKQMKDQMYEKLVAQWMLDVCTAIFELHRRNIIHRDIKPDNFMVKTIPEVVGGRLVLSDFGLSVVLKKNQLLKEQCGTPAFMAPEIRSGKGYGFPVDLWAAGVMQYMMMNRGEHPFISEKGGYNAQAEKDLKNEGVGSIGLGSQSASAFLMGMIFPESTFSEECEDLCKDLLRPSPSTRLSAEAALKGDWLQGAKAKPIGKPDAGKPWLLNNRGGAESIPLGKKTGPANVF